MFFLRGYCRAHTSATNNITEKIAWICTARYGALKTTVGAAVYHTIGSPDNRRCSLAQVRPVRRRQPTGLLKHAAMQNHDPPFQWTKDLQLSIPCWQSTWIQKCSAWNSPNEMCPVWITTNKMEGHISLSIVTCYGLNDRLRIPGREGVFLFLPSRSGWL